MVSATITSDSTIPASSSASEKTTNSVSRLRTVTCWPKLKAVSQSVEDGFVCAVSALKFGLPCTVYGSLR